MLQLAQARKLFGQIASLPLPQRPVVQRVAMQHLANVAELCPLTPDAGHLRLANTREPVSDTVLHEYPNSALLLRRAAGHNNAPERASAFLEEARLLDPLGDW